MRSNNAVMKIDAKTAAEVCAQFSLRPDAKVLLRNGMSPREFIDALASGKQYVTGMDFMAHALPPRESIWWGALCLQYACGDNLSPLERTALHCVVHWILQPVEQVRLAAKGPADAVGPMSPSGALALAVYQTSANGAPGKSVAVLPKLGAPAKAVANAVKLACLRMPPAQITDTQRGFFELAISVAEGRHPCPELSN